VTVLRLKLQAYRLVSRLGGAVMAMLVRGLFALARAIGPERSSDAGAFLARCIGRLLKQNRIALANVRAAYPQASAREVAAIVDGAWANLGRTGAEYAHLATIFDYDPDAAVKGRIEVGGDEHFLALRDDGRAGIVFAAHLGNWELPAICAARFGLETTAIFRPPNDPAAARVVQEVRSGTMGGLAASTGGGAAYAVSGVLDRGGHVGQLIDQHFTRGVVVEFMGRPCLANPLLAKLARHHDVPVHGARVIRLGGHRFRLEITPPLDLPRDPDGQINVQGATQAMTRVVEGWVREHPEQWLWMHRRWRLPPAG
jgi:KDO2-lipid IV(A) lauroyltransferase